MKQALYKKYANTKAIGVLPLNNFGGIEFLDIEYGINDYIIACFNFGTGRQQIRRHKVNCTTDDRLYIRKQGRRYYIADVIGLDMYMAVEELGGRA